MVVAAKAAMLLLLHKSLGQVIALLAGVGVFTAIDFNHTITLGSVLIAFIIIALAGIFTIRSKIASIWREEAEGERATAQRLQKELEQVRHERLAFEAGQQELRHDLKNQLAACHAQIAVLEAKTDLTVALDAIRNIGENGTAVSRELIGAISGWNEQSIVRDDQTHELLKEIRDKLPTEPITIKEIKPEGGKM